MAKTEARSCFQIRCENEIFMVLSLEKSHWSYRTLKLVSCTSRWTSLDDDTSEYSGKENKDVIIATSRTNGTVGNNSKKETGKRGFLSGLRNRRKSDGIKEKDDISLT